MADLTEVTSAEGGLTATGRDALLREFDEQKTTANFAVYLMVVVIAGYAAITVINTLVSSMTARRREFGLQRLAGSTRGQVLRMAGSEAAIPAPAASRWAPSPCSGSWYRSASSASGRCCPPGPRGSPRRRPR
ncbi:ABC transporter permease [Umezawaea sp.]|uniref:ABC transporter permease n=1 Tax=Umezawaea sp. TaxID=1955258 RepID=UPI002ED66DD8